MKKSIETFADGLSKPQILEAQDGAEFLFKSVSKLQHGNIS